MPCWRRAVADERPHRSVPTPDMKPSDRQPERPEHSFAPAGDHPAGAKSYRPVTCFTDLRFGRAAAFTIAPFPFGSERIRNRDNLPYHFAPSPLRRRVESRPRSCDRHCQKPPLVSSARQRPRNNSLFPQTDSKFRLRYPEPAVCCKYHSHLRTTDRPPDPSSRHALRPAAPPQSGAYSIHRRDKPASPVEQDSGRSTPFHGPNAAHPP